MTRWLYLVLVTALTSTGVPADSIRIDGQLYRDVYIRTSKDFYRVYYPEEGRVERVSRRRSTVTDVHISDDVSYREGLLERYETQKAAPAVPATESRPTASVPTLKGDLMKFQLEMRSLAAFESQLAHWKTLSGDVREDIEAGLYETLAERTARRAADRDEALAQVQQLGSKKLNVEEQLAAAARDRAEAVQQVQAADQSDFYLRAYENSKGYVGPVYHYYFDECDGLRTFPTWWYTEDPSLYKAALAEQSQTRRQINTVENVYAEHVSAYGKALEQVDRAMTQQERQARASVSKAIDEQHRYGSRQAQVAALASAMEADYRPRLVDTPLESWSGSVGQRTPEFYVGRGLWRIDCRVADEATATGFSVTLYDAETGKPFTRISGPDYLGMRTRVFDQPGRYYLVVAQGGIPVPYEITVSAVSLR